MGRLGSVIPLFLAIAVLFSLLSIAPFVRARQVHVEIAPNRALVSQLDAVEASFRELKRYDPDATDVALFNPYYNVSMLDQGVQLEQIYGQYYNWSLVHHLREHPEGLQLPVYYFHPNGTRYRMSADGDAVYGRAEVTNAYCNPNANTENKTCSFSVYQSLSDRFVYFIELAAVPSGLANNFLVDAETGVIVKSTLDSNIPRGVNIYDDIASAKTVRQLNEERLHPELSTELKIAEGASMHESKLDFVPSDARAILAIDNRVVWTNKDTVNHTVRSDNGYVDPLSQKHFASGEIKPGEHFEYTFTQVGKFGYHCDIHPWMKGTIEIVPNFA